MPKNNKIIKSLVNPDERTSISEDNLPNPNGVDQTEDSFYAALSHEFRRKIILYIGKNEFAGFSNIKKELSTSTGTIYHHLDALKELIIQDEKKKYHLTPLGMHAYRFLNQNLDSMESEDSRERIMTKTPGMKFFDYFLFKKIFNSILEQPKYGYILSSVIILFISLLCAIFKIQSYLFFYFPAEENLNPVIPINTITLFAGNILGYLILFLTTEFLCRFVFNKKENVKGLLATIGMSYIPWLFYLVIIGFLNIFLKGNSTTISRLFLILFQVWSMGLLAYSISISKYIRIERGIIIAIFIDYGTFMLILLLENPIL